VPAGATDEETLFNVVLDAGAEDVRSDADGGFEVVTQPESFAAVRQAIEDAKLPLASADYTLEPTDTVELDAKDTALLMRLLDRLEDDEDVQNVHANFEASDEVLEAAAGT
jgi:transcriptional/translational regulatory protein YebC/TACO1